MISRTTPLTLDEVLDAFAVEPNIDRATLERYLGLYPEFAAPLVDLSHELLSVSSNYEGDLSSEDDVLLSKAFAIHDATLSGPIPDPFEKLSRDELKTLASELEVPRQIVMALRERCIELGSIPRWLLRKLAEHLDGDLTNLFVYFTYPPGAAYARSYKSDGKPGAAVQVTFEQALIDAGVSEEKRKTLLADD